MSGVRIFEVISKLLGSAIKFTASSDKKGYFHNYSECVKQILLPFAAYVPS